MPWIRKSRTAPVRDITPSDIVSGRVLIERDGRVVWLHFEEFVPSATEQGSMSFAGLIPAGFRPPRNIEVALAPRIHNSTNEVRGALRVLSTGTSSLYRVPAGGIARGMLSWLTDDVMPS